MELTAHHSNRLEVSGGTAKVNGNAADFARPGADVTVTATDLSAKGHQFDHWEVSGGDIGRTGDDLKANPLNIKKMPDAAVKLTAVYRALSRCPTVPLRSAPRAAKRCMRWKATPSP